MIDIMPTSSTDNQNDKSKKLRIAPFINPSVKSNIYFLSFISYLILILSQETS
jgi:hypothetical protein